MQIGSLEGRMALLTPPHDDDIEVTLIGPNVGESVIIHYKKNWLLIDSCKDRASGLPAALRYLNDLKVSSDQVKIIACSHWHDDHFKGLGQLYAAYPTAKFWMSGALKQNEFITLMEAYREWPAENEPLTSGLKELTACIDQAKKQGSAPNFSTHDQRMWLASDSSAELWSLSPSSEMIRLGFEDISQLIPKPWAVKNGAAIKGPNHIAVAMHFRAGEHSVLLGSDLEEHGNPLTGWSAVLNSTSKPPQMASLYKVAHHGSQTAEHPKIWSDLLKPRPVSVITPFSRSRLPLDRDVTRIKGHSSQVFLSSRQFNSENRRTGALGKMTRQKNMRLIDGSPGLIQCRVRATDANATWTVVLGEFATRL
jgi:beta-lactamase superfamily II metal-dependent hydrolase